MQPDSSVARVARALLALLLVVLLIPLAPTPIAGAQGASATLELVDRDEAGMNLRFVLPALDVRPTSDGDYSIVSIPGLLPAGDLGGPELPVITARVVVPPNVPVSLTVTAATARTVTLDAPPLPAAGLSAEFSPDGNLARTRYAVEPGDIYLAVGVHPPELCVISADDVVRRWRLLQITCTPARYQPGDRSLLVADEAHLRLSFADTAGDAPGLAAQSADPLAATLAAALLNPGDMARYPVIDAPVAAAALPEPAGSFRLQVDEEGLYAITHDELVAAGAAVTGIDSRTIRLTGGGEEVAILVEDSDDEFGSGDRFLFYGQPSDSIYGAANAYLLSWGGADGRRLETRPAAAAAATPGQLLAVATLRNYDPRWPDPWRADWTDLYLYDSAYSAAAEDGHYYAGQLVPGSDGAPADPEWFAATLPGLTGRTGTLTVTLRSPEAASSNKVDFAFGSITQAAAHTTFVPFVSRGGTTGVASVKANAAGLEPTYTALGQESWTGSDAVTYQFPVAVTDGLHVLKLTLPERPLSRVMVVAPTITYPVSRALGGSLVADGQAGAHTYRVSGVADGPFAVWDVTDPSRPVALSGIAPAAGGRLSFSDDPPAAARYALASSSGVRRVSAITKLSPVALQPAAQYLIITHPDFLSAAQNLAAHRSASGLSTRVVTTQSIYDRLSAGLMDAEAIRTFVREAYASWRDPDGGPTLTYLLLLGDGSYDFKDRLNHGAANYVPPYLGEDFDPYWEGQSASDHMYANERLTVPSVQVGRVPVRTAAEASAVVGKIIAYETEGAGSALQNALFAADDPDMRDYGNGEELSYSFSEMAEEAIRQATSTGAVAPGGVRRVYHSDDEQASEAAGYYWVGSDDALVEATNALMNYWRQGALLTYYTGHSHFWGWAFPSLLHADSASGLDRSPLTMLLSMTCFTGVFYHPNAPSLDEALLLRPNGGTIASLSPMGMGSSGGHRQMQGPAISSLLSGATAGEALLAAKLELTAHYSDLIDTHAVLGDPAVSLVPGTPPASTNDTLLPMVANGGS